MDHGIKHKRQNYKTFRRQHKNLGDFGSDNEFLGTTTKE